MSRCKYLVKNKNVALADGKIHTTFACNNKKCKNYLRYSIGKASICGNCLLHEKRKENENEIKETREWLQDFIRAFGCNFDDLETRGFNECVMFLKELEQYRAIGTIDEFKALKEKQKYCLGYRLENEIKSPQFD